MSTRTGNYERLESQSLEAISKTLRELANLIDALALENKEQRKAEECSESMQSSENTVYTLQDACNYLKISRNTLSKLLRSGKLKGFKVGQRWFITQKALDKLTDS